MPFKIIYVREFKQMALIDECHEWIYDVIDSGVLFFTMNLNIENCHSQLKFYNEESNKI